ncbi:unnamed protein product [Onchocerca ochengi]|uniref:Integrase_SAM-like_N domain-containing protein n=1 Tax=Onchocerca ochengi TaxID=42157 RepID=A0A182EKA9_ONCOC|nr:unnamed protein product [Onchocerca ochengi]
MSSSIIASIQPPKARSLKMPTWLTYIQTITGTKKRDEEKAYEQVTEGEHGLFQIMYEGKEAYITSKRYKNDAEQKLEQLIKRKSKEQERLTTPSNLTVNLPQLSLPTFNGDLRQWRQFWSSFNAAVHLQTIPEIQKLNYLFSCLRGKALQVVSGYEIAPENYEVIRRLLEDKYGNPSTIKMILYSEFQSIKKNGKEWITTIENIERVLRQLEALGENLVHTSIETSIEGRLLRWILEKVYQQKETDKPWSVVKLRNFLSNLIYINEQVKCSQLSHADTNQKTIIPKPEQISRSNFGRTSALATIRNDNKGKIRKQKRRPCIFCAQDH